ncbi:Actin-Related Protein 2/3 Complex Subunit 1B [Manis pentadactyla]|nr:Actin-Related Protein 2/3 Complex Subunit 1B [Manis pentadactyla]
MTDLGSTRDVEPQAQRLSLRGPPNSQHLAYPSRRQRSTDGVHVNENTPPPDSWGTPQPFTGLALGSSTGQGRCV